MVPFWIRNRNFSKVGTGTAINRYGSTTLACGEGNSNHIHTATPSCLQLKSVMTTLTLVLVFSSCLIIPCLLSQQPKVVYESRVLASLCKEPKLVYNFLVPFFKAVDSENLHEVERICCKIRFLELHHNRPSPKHCLKRECYVPQ